MVETLVSIARSWIGTPFLHQGRKKQVGCDCIGLVVGVLQEAGVTFDGKTPLALDKRDYTMQPDGKRLLKVLSTYLKQVPLMQMQAGDIVLMRFEREPQHVGVLGSRQLRVANCEYGKGSGFKRIQAEGKTNILTLIHCYQAVGKVVEHHLDVKWQRRVVAVFRPSLIGKRNIEIQTLANR